MTRYLLIACSLWPVACGLLMVGCGERPASPQVLPRADLEVGQVNVEVGEPLAVRIVVLHPRASTPEVEFDAEQYGLTLLDSGREAPTPLPAALAKSVFTYRLAGYVPGPVELGPVTVRLETDKTLSTGKVLVKILSPIGDDTPIDLSQLRPPKPAVPVPAVHFRRFLAYSGAAAGLLVLAVAAAVWRALRRRRRQPLPQISPEQAALRRLDEIAELIAAADSLQPVYYEMNMTLRRYIEQRFSILAARQTSEEFLAAAGERLPAPLRAGLAGYMAHCDLVKYAAIPAGREEAAEAVERARKFVRTAGDIIKARELAADGERRVAAAAAGG